MPTDTGELAADGTVGASDGAGRRQSRSTVVDLLAAEVTGAAVSIAGSTSRPTGGRSRSGFRPEAVGSIPVP